MGSIESEEHTAPILRVEVALEIEAVGSMSPPKLWCPPTKHVRPSTKLTKN
jgi:hypothetical protein